MKNVLFFQTILIHEEGSDRYRMEHKYARFSSAFGAHVCIVCS